MIRLTILESGGYMTQDCYGGIACIDVTGLKRHCREESTSFIPHASARDTEAAIIWARNGGDEIVDLRGCV